MALFEREVFRLWSEFYGDRLDAFMLCSQLSKKGRIVAANICDETFTLPP